MWEVTWKPEVTALGVDRIPREDSVLMEKEVVVVREHFSFLVRMLSSDTDYCFAWLNGWYRMRMIWIWRAC